MSYQEEIEKYRTEINRLNEEILNEIGERVQVARKIGEIKKRYGKPIVDREREEKVIEQVQKLAEERELDPERVSAIFRKIIDLCVEAEERL
jgi:chorismate mutase